MAKKRKGNLMPVAEQLYMSGQYSNEEIADILGLHANTVSNWVTDGNWKLLKGAAESGRASILKNTLLQIEKITKKREEGEEPFGPKEADMVLKLSKVAEQFSPNRASVANEIETITRFMSYLYEVDHDLAKMVTDPSRDFIQTRINDAIQ